MSPEWDDDTKVSPTELTSPGPGERDRAYLIVLAGANVGEMYKVGKTEVVLGRGQQADVQILDEGVSRRHAVVRLAGSEMVLEDLSSRNGTYVNAERVATRKLSDGDKIQVGSTTILKFTYHDQLDETFQRRMYESALRDGLTKAFNKKYFVDRLDSEFRFARRHKVALSLLMMDVDHFKEINDQHGHPVGDHVLATLAKRIQESIRNEDVFARYGGEEFVLLCRAIEVDNAMLFAERLRKAVAGMECRAGDTVIPVTISIGVAGLPQVAAHDPQALLAAADDALYHAKGRGRNRVWLFGRDA